MLAEIQPALISFFARKIMLGNRHARSTGTQFGGGRRTGTVHSHSTDCASSRSNLLLTACWRENTPARGPRPALRGRGSLPALSRSPLSRSPLSRSPLSRSPLSRSPLSRSALSRSALSRSAAHPPLNRPLARCSEWMLRAVVVLGGRPVTFHHIPNGVSRIPLPRDVPPCIIVGAAY
jgi:hypothetical protein